MGEVKSYDNWKQFSKNYQTVTVYLTPEEIFYTSPLDKNRSHVAKVKDMFKEKGIEITRFRHNYKTNIDKDYWGLVFHRSDSDIQERVEITCIIGVNAQYIKAAAVDNPNTGSSPG